MRRIFISHSSRDSEIAAELKRRLEARGYRSVFLDFDPADGIPAGREWERELYQRIRSCQAMVVVCSESSMASRWCFMEITHARALGKPLLAFKIDGCKLDGVLADRQAVDLVRDGDFAYDRLLGGLGAAGLDPAASIPWDPARPPYPGLLAFQEADAGVFFGRGDEISQGLELLNRVRHLGEPGFVMVLGASGTGKSSLVRAGLLPRFAEHQPEWFVLPVLRPRANGRRELESILNRDGPPDLAEQYRSRHDVAALADYCRAFRRRFRLDGRFLLVVDQFEELLAGVESDPFLAELRCAAEDREASVLVLGTMRSDFLDRFQNSKPLLDVPYQVLSLGPMSQPDIREIIECPAREVDGEIEPALVDRLIQDSGAPNALPLLAFTLRELWERYGDDRRVTLDEYREKLGGVQEVVGKAADDVLASARVTREQEQALRAAFLAMMRVTDDGKYARRLAYWDDLPASVHPLLERFVAARLLVSGADGARRTIEVAHERLFDSWRKLRGWIAENEQALTLRQEIDAAAKAWAGGTGQAADPGRLWHDARISRAREFVAAGTLLLDDLGRRFIDASESRRETAARPQNAHGFGRRRRDGHPGARGHRFRFAFENRREACGGARPNRRGPAAAGVGGAEFCRISASPRPYPHRRRLPRNSCPAARETPLAVCRQCVDPSRRLRRWARRGGCLRRAVANRGNLALTPSHCEEDLR